MADTDEHTSRSRAGRSWDAPRKSLAYAIEATQLKHSQQLCEEGEENTPPEYLILDHFTPQPKLDFGKVKVGHGNTRLLYVRNPREYEQKVLVEKFPHGKGYLIESECFSVGPGESRAMRVQWEPKEPGNSREMVRFQVDGNYRLMAYLLGQCPQPPQPKKKKGGTISSLKQPAMSQRQQAAFSRVRNPNPLLALPQRNTSLNQSASGKRLGSPTNKPKPAVTKPSAVLRPSTIENRIASSNFQDGGGGFKKPARPASVDRQGENKRLNGQPEKQPALNRAVSCNERILQGTQSSDKAPLDPRLTMRLSKPTVLPQTHIQDTVKDQSRRQSTADPMRLTMRLDKPIILRESGQYVQSSRLNENEQIHTAMHSNNFENGTPIKKETCMNANQKQNGGQTSRESTAGFTSDEEIVEYEEIVERTETYTEYVEHCEVRNEIIETIDTIETDINGHEKIVNSQSNTYTTTNDYQRLVASSYDVTENLLHSEHAHMDHVASTPRARDCLHPDDIECDTPSRRMTFRKAEPTLPCTPVRRDTIHLQQPSQHGTPIIKSPVISGNIDRCLSDVSSNEYTPVGYERLSSRRERFESDGLTRDRSRARSESPVGRHQRRGLAQAGVVVFSDDTHIQRTPRITVNGLSSVVEPEMEHQTLTPANRTGTYTKLDSSLSPPLQQQMRERTFSGSTKDSPLSLCDLELPYCEDTSRSPGLNSVSRRKRDPKKLSVISERSVLSRDSLDGVSTSDLSDKDLKTSPIQEHPEDKPTGHQKSRILLEDEMFDYSPTAAGDDDGYPDSRSVGHGSPKSMYATARTSPCHLEGSDNQNGEDDIFEDSVAYLDDTTDAVLGATLRSRDASAHATTLENSALMTSILQQKLQQVARFMEEEEDSQNDDNDKSENESSPDRNATGEKHVDSRNEVSDNEVGDNGVSDNGVSDNEESSQHAPCSDVELSPDMSLGEFQRRMASVVPDTSFKEDSPCAKELQDIIQNSRAHSLAHPLKELINSSLSSSIAASPVFKPFRPIPQFSSGITPHLKSSLNPTKGGHYSVRTAKDKLVPDESFVSSVIDSPLFKPLPAIPQFTWDLATPQSRHLASKQNGVAATENDAVFRMPLPISTDVKYRPSELPQNPFDMTRSSVIGVVNPGMDDSIFATDRMSLAPRLSVRPKVGILEQTHTEAVSDGTNISYKQDQEACEVPLDDSTLAFVNRLSEDLPPVPLFESNTPASVKTRPKTSKHSTHTVDEKTVRDVARRGKSLNDNDNDDASMLICEPVKKRKIDGKSLKKTSAHFSSELLCEERGEVENQHENSSNGNQQIDYNKRRESVRDFRKSVNYKQRPSMMPQNPFEMTRSSTIGVVNPGMDDSIFAERSKFDRQIVASFSRSQDLMKGQLGALIDQSEQAECCSTNQVQRTSENEAINDDLYKTYPIGMEHDGRLAQSSANNNKLETSVYAPFNPVQQSRQSNATFEKINSSLCSSVTSSPQQKNNRTFEKEQAVGTNRTFEQTDTNMEADGKMMTSYKEKVFEDEERSENEEESKKNAPTHNGSLYEEDEPLTLHELATSPISGKGMLMETRERLSSTPAATGSATRARVSGHVFADVTPLRAQQPLPSPIANQGTVVKTRSDLATVVERGFSPTQGTHPAVTLQSAFTAAALETETAENTDARPSSSRNVCGAGVTLEMFPPGRDFKRPISTKIRRLPNMALTMPPKRLSRDRASLGAATLPIGGENVEAGNDADKRARSLDGNVAQTLPQTRGGGKVTTKPSVSRPPAPPKRSPVKRELSSGPLRGERKRFCGERQPLTSSTRVVPNAASKATTAKMGPEKPAPVTDFGTGSNRILSAKSGTSSLRLSRTTLLRQQAALNKNEADSVTGKDTVAKVRMSASMGGPRPHVRKSTGDKASRSGAVKGVPQRTLSLLKNTKTAVPRHPLLFAAKNIYYDERWMEKQDRAFTKWLNYVLTPPDWQAATNKPGKLDLGALMSGDRIIPVAPTKEQVSFHTYSQQRRLNRLRRDACRLFTSDAFVTMTTKLEREINCGRIAIRADRNVFADLGLAKKVLDLLLGYNPLWLRVGIEVVYGELLDTGTRADVMRISHFLLRRLLGNPDIRAEFAHPSVPNSFRPGYYEALGQFALKKFLVLVTFLDLAKTSRLIAEDPCLFCLDASEKSSSGVLLSFSRDLLRSEGDLVKHLALLGYRVKHAQTALEEVDYGVNNLATDLRDGLRLTRVVSLLSGDWSLTSAMRCPAISRLQKVHNVQVALRALTDRGAMCHQSSLISLLHHRVVSLLSGDWSLTSAMRCPAISRLQKVHNVQVALRALTARGASLNTARGGAIEAKDIVDGHHEKTLQLLWTLIHVFQVEQAIDKEALKEEISLLRKALVIRQKLAALERDILPCEGAGGEGRDSVGGVSDLAVTSEPVQLLLRWARLVCAHYDINIENFTVSFCDGRAFLYLIKHYQSGLVPRVHDETTQTHAQSIARDYVDQSADDSLSFNDFEETDPAKMAALLGNEKENFRLLAVAASQLGSVPAMLKHSDMSGTIPDEKVVVTYVSYLCARLLDLRAETRAARIIQAAWRQWLIKHRTGRVQIRQQAARVLQRHIRSWLSRRRAERQLAATLCIQRYFRGYRARKLVWGMRKERAAICIQKYMRGFLARRLALQIRREIEENVAAVCLQSVVRGYLARCYVARMREYLHKNSAAVCVQRYVRGYLARKRVDSIRQEVKQTKAAVYLQSNARGFLARKFTYRLREERNKLQAALCLQKHSRGFLARKLAKLFRLEAGKQRAAVVLQKFVRGYLARQQVKRLRAAICLQKYTRGLLARKLSRRLHENRQNHAAICIQKQARVFLARRTVNNLRKAKQTRAAVTLQKYMRSLFARRLAKRMRIVNRNQAAVCLQSYVRRFLATKCVVAIWNDRRKQAAICLQKYTRARLARVKVNALRLERRNQAALCIQKTVRMFFAKRCMQQMLTQRRHIAAVSLQKYIRSYLARCTVRRLLAERRKKATLCLQTNIRGFLARKLVKYLREERRQNAAICLQKYIRGFLARSRANRLRTECRIHAAICLQKYVRSYLAKCHTDRLRQARNQGAALCIQRYAKGLLARALLKRLKIERELLRNGAAIVIQKHVRCFLASRYVARLRLQRRNDAATCLQKYTRSFLAMVVLKRIRERIRYQAAIEIQRHIRGFLARRQVSKIQQERRHLAAVVIQTHVRSYLARKYVAKLRLQRRSEAATCLQKYLRGFLARVLVKRLKEQKRNHAAIEIQRHIRGFLAKRQVSKMLQERRHLAAVVLQTHVRSFLARKYVVKLRHQKRSEAATCLQKYLRGYLARVVVKRLKEYKRNRAAIEIQRHIRGFLAKRQVSKMQRVRRHLAAVILQAHVRSFFARKYVAKLRHQKRSEAATCLQKYTRSYLARIVLKRIRENKRYQAAIVIQRHIRGFLARCQVSKIQQERRHLAAVVLQTHVRSFLARKYVAKLRLQRRIMAATCLQKYLRGYLARVVVKRLKSEKRNQAAIEIQRHIRGFLARRQASKMLQERRHLAAVVLQTHVRSFLARKCVAKLRHQKRSEAAMRLQKYLRSYFARVVVKRLKEQKRNHAAIEIQRHIRGFFAKRQVSKMLQERRYSAATVLQKYIRAFLARRQVAKMVEKRRNSAAICLQKYIRRYLARNYASKLRFDKHQRASILIQRHVRGFLARKLRMRLLAGKRNQAAVVIQSQMRGYLARCRVTRLRQQRIHNAAICIQKYSRACLARKLMVSLRHAKRNNAGTCLQKYARAFIARNRVQQLRKERKRLLAAIVLQKYTRAVLAKRCVQRMREERQRNAAINIQRHIRGMLDRVYANKLRMQKREHAAICIQKYARRFLARIQQRTLAKQRLDAVVCLQSFWRAFMARRYFAQLRHRKKQNDSAIAIQKHVRSFLVRQYLKKRLAEKRHRSAIVLQKTVRGFLARRLVARMLFERQHSAAICIQKFVRMHLAKQCLKILKAERLESATVCLQKYTRGCLARIYVCKLRLERKRQAAILIQKHVRAFFAKKYYCRLQNERRNKAAVCIQKYVRAMLAMSVAMRLRIERSNQAAVCLQKYIRAYLAKICVNRRIEELGNSAAIAIQRLFRGYVARKEVRRIKCERQRHFSAICIQRYFRGLIARKVVRTLKFERKRYNAAVCLQRYIRGFIAKRRVEQIRQTRRNKSAIVLQKFIRGFLAKRTVKQMYIEREIQQNLAAVCIQKYVRRFLAVKYATMIRFEKQSHAAVCIQTHVRGFIARRYVTQLRKFKRERAVVCLQKCVRVVIAKRFVSRLRTQKRAEVDSKAAVTLQKIVRSYLAKKQFKQMRIEKWQIQVTTATVCIQKHVRRVLAKRRVVVMQRKHTEHRAAILIQRIVRGYLARKQYEALKVEIRLKKNSAANVVQCCWRQYTARKVLETLKREKRARQELQAAQTIQTWYRASVQRRHSYTEQHHRAASVLQRYWRKYRSRRRESRAALCIQKSVRGYLVRRQFVHYKRAILKAQVATVKYKRAILKAQALWRGRQTRRRASLNARITRARQRIETARVNAEGQQSLAQRTKSALDFLLACKYVDPLIEALTELDTLTQLLPHCCERLVEVSAVPVLYRLISACNRSEPHIRIITLTLNTLLNVAMYEKTRLAVYIGESGVSVLVEQIKIHRFKKTPIFTRACTLLGVLAQHPLIREDMLAQKKHIQQLQAVHGLVTRRNAAADTRKETAARMAALRAKPSALNSSSVVQQGGGAYSAVHRLVLRPAWLLKRGRSDVLDEREAVWFSLHALGLV